MPDSPTLSPCPDSPNCVSSQSNDPEHYVKPFTYSGPMMEAKSRLRSLFENQPRTRIVFDQEANLHIEIRSFLFGFIDDVEFIINDEQKRIHVRSASRTGYWDLGINRKRIESLRTKFHQSS